MEKKNQEITSQIEADAFSNALGDFDGAQFTRILSTKNSATKGKTFNMLDTNMLD